MISVGAKLASQYVLENAISPEVRKPNEVKGEEYLTTIKVPWSVEHFT
jgi:hypothetical protein